jgi:hypothetical protein
MVSLLMWLLLLKEKVLLPLLLLYCSIQALLMLRQRLRQRT